MVGIHRDMQVYPEVTAGHIGSTRDWLQVLPEVGVVLISSGGLLIFWMEKHPTHQIWRGKISDRTWGPVLTCLVDIWEKIYNIWEDLSFKTSNCTCPSRRWRWPQSFYAFVRQIEISQNLMNVSAGNVLKIFMVPGRKILSAFGFSQTFTLLPPRGKYLYFWVNLENFYTFSHVEFGGNLRRHGENRKTRQKVSYLYFRCNNFFRLLLLVNFLVGSVKVCCCTMVLPTCPLCH